MIISLISVFIAPVACQFQFGDVRPDVAFGEQNDRFDLTDMINHQRKKDHGQMRIDYQYDEYRRSHKKTKQHKRLKHSKKALENARKNEKKIRKRVIRERKEHINKLANEILLAMSPKRRSGVETFAYHDKMEDDGGNEFDFDENLNLYDKNAVKEENDFAKYNERRMIGFVNKLHGFNGRRVFDPEKEILFHHGFPVDMKIKGYIQIPLQQ